MSTKARPANCAAPTTLPITLPTASRDRLVAGFKALGDPTRLEVFRLIAAQQGSICVCDIVERFDVSQPTISHHLKVLREAGLITGSRNGVWAHYSVDPRGLDLLGRFFDRATPQSVAAD